MWSGGLGFFRFELGAQQPRTLLMADHQSGEKVGGPRIFVAMRAGFAVRPELDGQLLVQGQQLSKHPLRRERNASVGGRARRLDQIKPAAPSADADGACPFRDLVDPVRELDAMDFELVV